MSRNTMTRMHFQLIAETIRASREAIQDAIADGRVASKKEAIASLRVLEDLAGDFANKLADTNSGFRREQFLAACDPAEEYKPRRVGRNQHSHLTTYSETELADSPGNYGATDD